MDKKDLEEFRNKMDNKTIQTVYFDKNCLDLANKEDLIKDLEPTLYKGKESKNSLSFEDKSALSKYFGIEEDDLLKLDNRITTIHSSALLAFLAFYKVSEGTPIKINDIDYTQRFFEVKNKCIDPQHPSQVDVVLADKEWNNVLYLESKFTEPLTNSKAYNISADYKDEKKGKGIGCKIYNENFFDKDERFGLILKDSGKGDGSFNIEPRGTDKFYLPGIKQMISHYIGMLRGSNGKNRDTFGDEFEEKIKNAEKFHLASIVYDFSDETFKERMDKYKCLYTNLADKLNTITEKEGYSTENKRYSVMPELLTYQKVFSDKRNNKLLNVLSDSVKTLYNIGN